MTGATTRLLLADDDTELCDLLRQYLESEGFEVDLVHDGAAAVAAVLAKPYQLLILDVMMPALNGFEALRQVRAQKQTPVLMLTARGDDVDRIVGLEMGADDYLAKPCNPRELVARIRAVLRRAAPSEAAAVKPTDPISIAGVELQPAARKAFRDGELLDLTSTEFNVLMTLMQRAGEVVNKKLLTEAVLERKLEAYDRSMDMHVSNLRKKISRQGDREDLIKTIRGVGYMFAVAVEQSNPGADD